MKILICMSLVMIWGVQPIIMVGSLILMTLIYSLMMYLMMGSFWYSYMVLLVMLSGVLVIFTYISSLTPNESFELENLMYLSFFFGFLMMMNFNMLNMYLEDLSLYSMKMWNFYVSIYMYYLVMFLFLIMIMVVWLSKMEYGALRNY